MNSCYCQLLLENIGLVMYMLLSFFLMNLVGILIGLLSCVNKVVPHI